MDRYDLYELCVQRPTVTVDLLAHLHGGSPVRLHEDFCGSGAVARAWVSSDSYRSAIGIDADEQVLTVAHSRAHGVAIADGCLRFIRAELGNDTHSVEVMAVGDADVIFAGNFSIGELHTRSQLLCYLRSCSRRLRRGGLCACDTYGGRNAFVPGLLTRTFVIQGSESTRSPVTVVRYGYEQVRADPFTGIVENHLHFDVTVGGEIVERRRSAFVYRWRIWSVPEVREAMTESGFRSTEVHWDLTDQDRSSASEPPDTYAALIVGRH